MNKLLLLILSTGFLFSNGQLSGKLDPTFKLSLPIFTPTVRALAFQTITGKVIIGGRFDFKFNNSKISQIARLMDNGTVDLSFKATTDLGEVYTLTFQSDGKLLVGGSLTHMNLEPVNQIVRLNENGTIDTTFSAKSFTTATTATGHTEKIVRKIIVQSDGKILVVGSFTNYDNVSVGGLVRLNSDGSRDTSFNSNGGFLVADRVLVFDVVLQPDGKIVLGGSFSFYAGQALNSNCIVRLNPNGSIDGSFDAGTGANPFNGGILSLALQPNGKILVGGLFASFNNQLKYNLIRLNENGSIDTTFDVNNGAYSTFPAGVIYSISVQPKGKIIVGGFFKKFGNQEIGGIVILDKNGNIDSVFKPIAGITAVGSFLVNTTLAINNKLIIAGSFSNYDNARVEGICRLFLDKGVFGYFFTDPNNNCIKDSLEFLIPNKKAIIEPGGYIVKTSNGYWHIDSLPAGNYTVTTDTLDRWLPSCAQSVAFTVTHPDSVTECPPLGFNSMLKCSEPEISVHAPILRRCFSNQKIYIQSSNQSITGGNMINAYVKLQLDSLIQLDSASVSYTALGNSTYRFNLDTIYASQSKRIIISTSISCNAVLGQTLCMRAKIFPVETCVIDTNKPRTCPDASTTCSTNFEGSNVVVKSRCVNDSVYLSVKNENPIGNNNMNCALPVNIFRDGVLIQTYQVQLSGGDSIIYKFQGDGRTWRIGSTQHPKHPRQGCPNSTIEACGDSTNWIPGLVNILPVNEVQNIEATFCGVVRGSYDPNDKTGFPLGVTTNHFIAPNQPMEYLIRFQNTGNDTAFTVVIRDTLDTDFDIFTVRSGVASHSYDFRMYGPRILEWTFNNILLPDSGTNEPASNGFVKFSVLQNKDLSDGTEFNNRVGIYFDFNDPIITNTTSHIINRGIFKVFVSGLPNVEKAHNISVYPNPTNGILTLKGMNSLKSPYQIVVKGMMGNDISEKKYGIEDEFSLDLSNYSSGMYIIECSYKNGKEIFRVIR